MCYCGFFLSFLSGYQCEKKDHAFSSGFSRKMKSGWKAKIMVLFLALTNIPLAIYTSTVHQKGTTDVMEYIQIESSKLRSVNDMSVLFLMPCHSTPFYRYSTVFNFDGCSCETVSPWIESLTQETDLTHDSSYELLGITVQTRYNIIKVFMTSKRNLILLERSHKGKMSNLDVKVIYLVGDNLVLLWIYLPSANC